MWICCEVTGETESKWFDWEAERKSCRWHFYYLVRKAQPKVSRGPKTMLGWDQAHPTSCWQYDPCPLSSSLLGVCDAPGNTKIYASLYFCSFMYVCSLHKGDALYNHIQEFGLEGSVCFLNKSYDWVNDHGNRGAVSEFKSNWLKGRSSMCIKRADEWKELSENW